MSESNQPSHAFDLLDRSLQKWIWKEGWDQLRDIQEEAIPTILNGQQDVIIASATASGKTEAAYLPILTKALSNDAPGVFALYIGPLKALINDQYQRLIEMAEDTHLSVTRWHGDVSQSKKKNLLKRPRGVLLITPESLESIFVNHGTEVSHLFGALEYVLIDELHSFIGNERGRHLQSLLGRLELVLSRNITRIGLSATIGDSGIAKQYLREESPQSVSYIESNSLGTGVKLQLRGYENRQDGQSDSDQEVGYAAHDISKHIFNTLRGADNLIFANRRMDVELYADLLRRYSSQEHVPNEFWPHHGSLSKDLRETIEEELKDKNTPSTAVCTTTLEMGIDIGSVESIAQIGTPPSVASMRQRLGRSGRRGNPAVLRLYVQEDEITEQTPPQDRLRTELVQSIAVVNLLVDKWIEPPSIDRLHLSTLIQQLLSLIAQYGGVRAVDAWNILFEKGSFTGISKQQFIDLLRQLGEQEVIIQASDKTLTLGLKGERIVGHYSFYAAFNTPEEYQIIAGGKNIGTLPVEFPLVEDIHIIFAGKRWLVKSVDQKKKVVELERSEGGKPPKFGGSGGEVHDRIREEMLNVYRQDNIPVYINEKTKELLEEGRKYFGFYELDSTSILEHAKDTLLFVWKGSIVYNTIMLLLLNQGLDVSIEGIALRIRKVGKDDLMEAIRQIVQSEAPSPVDLVKNVRNKQREKYDYLLPPELLNIEFAARFVSLEKTIAYLKGIIRA